MKKITFAERLKEARKSAKLSQEALAKKIGRTKSTISRWESGERNPKMFEMVELENALGINAEALIYGTEEIKSSTLTEINKIIVQLTDSQQEQVLNFIKNPFDDNILNTIDMMSKADDKFRDKVASYAKFEYFEYEKKLEQKNKSKQNSAS